MMKPVVLLCKPQLSSSLLLVYQYSVTLCSVFVLQLLRTTAALTCVTNSIYNALDMQFLPDSSSTQHYLI
jgi:hypothetical protein